MRRAALPPILLWIESSESGVAGGSWTLAKIRQDPRSKATRGWARTSRRSPYEATLTRNLRCWRNPHCKDGND